MLVKTVDEAVDNVLKHLDEDSQHAREVARGSKENFIFSLYQKVVARLTEDNYTIDDVLKSGTARGKFLERDRLQVVVEVHEGIKKGSEKDQGDPIVTAAREVFKNRDELWSMAGKAAKGDETEQALYFTVLVRGYLKSKGVSLQHIDAHPEARVFFDSGRLGKAMFLYKKIFLGAPKREPAREDDLSRHVKELARQHAEPGVQGLFTRVGVKDKADDVDALGKALRQLLLQEHPDKKENPDEELVRDINEIRDLIRGGRLQDYREALDELRGNLPPKPK